MCLYRGKVCLCSLISKHGSTNTKSTLNLKYFERTCNIYRLFYRCVMSNIKQLFLNLQKLNRKKIQNLLFLREDLSRITSYRTRDPFLHFRQNLSCQMKVSLRVQPLFFLCATGSVKHYKKIMSPSTSFINECHGILPCNLIIFNCVSS